MTFRIAIAAAALVLASCGTRQPVEEFDRISEQFVYGSLALSPVGATANGYHQHDGKSLDEQLDDYSPEAVTAHRAFYNDFGARLDRIDMTKLSGEQRADYDLIRNQIASALLEFDVIQNYRHNPTAYVELLGNALDTPHMLAYAPLPVRYGHIISRLKQTPRLLDQARQNLISAPAIWIQVAKAENAGTRGLIDTDLRLAAPAERKAEYDAAATMALQALKGFDDFLDKTLSAKPYDWRLGKDNYARKFALELGADQTPEQALAGAERDMQDGRTQMLLIAKDLATKYKIPVKANAPPNALIAAVLDRVAETHASPDAYFSEAEQDLAEARHFVQEKEMLTLPPVGNLKVIETPEYMRGIYGVGGFNPAPVLQPGLGAYYWITPLNRADPAAIASTLREYNRYGLKILTIHEAMPGHYVQSEHANAIEPKDRRLLRNVFGPQTYVEGWAVYVTEAMLDHGYLQNSPELRLTFLKQQLRVFANTILDVRFHTMDLSDEDAMKLMLEQGFQEKTEAVKKLQRAKLSSCQLPTYYIGYKGWVTMRDRYKEAVGAGYTSKRFHDSALKEGPLPLAVLTKLLTQR